MYEIDLSQWEKSPKNSLKECDFVNSALKIYTPTDCFFGDFAHWDVDKLTGMNRENCMKELTFREATDD